MSHLPWGRKATPPPPKPPRHPHHLTETFAAAWHHVPHSLPEPHRHYPPNPSYLESSRLSREIEHL